MLCARSSHRLYHQQGIVTIFFCTTKAIWTSRDNGFWVSHLKVIINQYGRKILPQSCTEIRKRCTNFDQNKKRMNKQDRLAHTVQSCFRFSVTIRKYLNDIGMFCHSGTVFCVPQCGLWKEGQNWSQWDLISSNTCSSEDVKMPVTATENISSFYIRRI